MMKIAMSTCILAAALSSPVRGEVPANSSRTEVSAEALSGTVRAVTLVDNSEPETPKSANPFAVVGVTLGTSFVGWAAGYVWHNSRGQDYSVISPEAIGLTTLAASLGPSLANMLDGGKGKHWIPTLLGSIEFTTAWVIVDGAMSCNSAGGSNTAKIYTQGLVSTPAGGCTPLADWQRLSMLLGFSAAGAVIGYGVPEWLNFQLSLGDPVKGWGLTIGFKGF